MTLRLGNKKVCPTKLVKVNNVDFSKLNYQNDGSTLYSAHPLLVSGYYTEFSSPLVVNNGAAESTSRSGVVNFSQPFELNCEFIAPTTAGGAIFGNSYQNQYFRCPSAEFQANGTTTIWTAVSTDGTTWTNQFTFSTSEIPSVLGGRYIINHKYDGSNYTVSVTYNGNTVTKTQMLSTPPYFSNQSNASGSYLGFGGTADKSNLKFKDGKIWIGNTYIKQNGVLTWGCEAGQNYIEVDPNNYLISNVTKVGAVEDDKGVLSGFNSANYVKLPSDVSTSSANSWELIIPFRYSQVGTENQVLTGYSASGSNRYKSPQIFLVNGGRIEICFSSNGSSWDIASAASSTNTLAFNMDYIAKLSFNGTEYKLEISSDNGDSFETWVTVQSSTKSYGFYSTSLGSGGGSSAMFPINGLIDLNGCSLKVDNQTVWQGIVPQGTRG